MKLMKVPFDITAVITGSFKSDVTSTILNTYEVALSNGMSSCPCSGQTGISRDLHREISAVSTTSASSVPINWKPFVFMASVDSWSLSSPDGSALRTTSKHRNESWVKLLRYAYPSLIGKQPVFDSLI